MKKLRIGLYVTVRSDFLISITEYSILPSFIISPAFKAYPFQSKINCIFNNNQIT